jgi:4-hydroxy-tetrahydrodipicolinate synthase
MLDTSSGLVTSLVTPFASRLGEGGLVETEIDQFIFKAMLRWQASVGIEAVAVGGWIGEGPTLARTERITLVSIARAIGGDRMRVFAHVGSNNTERSILYALDAQIAGADALILVVPYYSRPSTEGVLGHVRRVARATSLPLILEFDARTALCPSIRDMAKLMLVDGVAGVIDHSANPLHVECLSASHSSHAFLTAHEPNAIASAAFGAHGLFSTAANVFPADVLAMWAACERGDFDAARSIHRRLLPMMNVIEEEGVPGVKLAMYPQIGLDPAVRLPLVAAGASVKGRVKDALKVARSQDEAEPREAAR